MTLLLAAMVAFAFPLGLIARVAAVAGCFLRPPQPLMLPATAQGCRVSLQAACRGRERGSRDDPAAAPGASGHGLGEHRGKRGDATGIGSELGTQADGTSAQPTEPGRDAASPWPMACARVRR